MTTPEAAMREAVTAARAASNKAVNDLIAHDPTRLPIETFLEEMERRGFVLVPTIPTGTMSLSALPEVDPKIADAMWRRMVEAYRTGKGQWGSPAPPMRAQGLPSDAGLKSEQNP